MAARRGEDPLQRGRQHAARRAWAEARAELARAPAPGADDLELWATAAYLAGRDDEYLDALERAHRAHRDAGAELRAARCAFWIGLRLMMRGEPARSRGWLARAQRLVGGAAHECVEAGYLLVAAAEQLLGAGEHARAVEAAGRAAAIGERGRDADLVAFARHLLGRLHVGRGRVDEGLALLDEVMVAVSGGELSPIVTGLMYCSVIACCCDVLALGRAREWTAALSRWCDEQPEMVAFTGACRVHRAEVMLQTGAWHEALVETRRVRADRASRAAALYQQGEVHRLRGEVAAAEEAYRAAAELGLDPHPGLALLRLARGRSAEAAVAIRRVLATAEDAPRRLRLLPAAVEIWLAGGAIDEARAACAELEALAARFATDVLGALAAHARGAVELAGGDALAALAQLRRACRVWLEVEAPYLAARARELVGRACAAVGDEEGARLELDAAAAAYVELGAAPDAARLRPARPHGLTRRELEILRLVAAGLTNKTIAGRLCLSERTIDRHVGNIFLKLDVPSRAAATAFAYEHQLV
jgi:DNA-binding CsgD family transcriptional regulator